MAGEAGRQAEISLTDSGDNGSTGMIAWKIITPKVFQAHDTMFSFIWYINAAASTSGFKVIRKMMARVKMFD